MPYQPPPLATLLSRTEADIESELPATYARTRFSVVGAIAWANAANAAGLHEHLNWTSRQIIPHLADEDKLLEHCEFWGVARKPATKSLGKINVTALTQTVISAGTQFQRPDGVIYEVINNTQLNKGENSIDVEAIDIGKNANSESGTPVQLISPVLSVNNAASIISMTGGAELEDIDSLRARLLFRVQYPPSGGNRYDYVRWSLEVPGVTRAWCIPRWRGHGSVGVLFVQDNEVNIFPTDSDIQRVYDYLYGHVNPITNQWEGKTTGAELIVESPFAKVIDIELRIVPNTIDVQTAVIESLRNYLHTLPIGGTALISELRAAVSNTEGEMDNIFYAPLTDIHAGQNEIFTLGNVTWR